MTRFGTESSSDLHCTNLYWSMDHPMDRSLNRQWIGSITSTDHVDEFGSNARVQNAATCNETQREKGKSIHPPNTLTHIPIHARHICIHTRVIHMHTYYTYILHIHTLHTSWILTRIHAKDSRTHTQIGIH